MRIAMQDRNRAAAVGALCEARRAVEQKRVEVPSFSRQAVAEPFLEVGDLAVEPLQILLDVVCVAPAPDRVAQTRVLPPVGVKARPGAKDGLAFAEGRRQRPGSDDLVRLAEVFEQEPPMVGLGVVFRFETSRQEAGGRRGGDLAIEFDLLPSAVPAAGQALRQAGLKMSVRGAPAASPS